MDVQMINLEDVDQSCPCTELGMNLYLGLFLTQITS